VTTTNHLLTGTIIGLVVHQPLVAVALAFASHFVQDAIPHFGYYGKGLGEAFKHKSVYFVEALNIIGIPLLISLLLHSHQSFWVFAAAFAAVSPDFMWVYRYFWFEKKGLTPPTGLLAHFHQKVQWYEKPMGVIIELIWLIGGFILLMQIL